MGSLPEIICGQYSLDPDVPSSERPDLIQMGHADDADPKALNKDHRSVVEFCAYDNEALSGHEWMVTAYDPATQTVTMCNPCGNSSLKPEETKNGVTALEDEQMKMSLSTFGKYCKK